MRQREIKYEAYGVIRLEGSGDVGADVTRHTRGVQQGEGGEPLISERHLFPAASGSCSLPL